MLKDFYYDYILLNLEDYGFGVDLEICKALFVVLIGVCFAMVMINYNRANIHLVLKQLIRHDAYGEENAKTLRQLGLCDKCAVKYSLCREGQLTKLVRRVGEEKLTYEEYIAKEKEKKQKRKENKALYKVAMAEYYLKLREAKEQGLTPPVKPTLDGSSSGEIDFTTAAFYIPEQTRERCKHIFENNSISFFKTVLSVAFMVVAYVILVMLMPDILTALSKLLIK